MLRSMYAGVSGLRSHQTMMDVVGNNIANVNTAGYKATRTTFAESLSQVVRGAALPIGGVRAGVNPMEIGLGTRVAAIDGVFSQGASQLTNRATDVTIQGQGFFAVNVNGRQLYTRAGAFSFDADGVLSATGGARVLGYVAGAPATGAPAEIRIDLAAYSDIAIDDNGGITGRDAEGNVVALGRLAVATFANEGGLNRVAGSFFGVSQNSGAANLGGANEGGRGTVQSGVLEMSNVDLSQEFTNLIVAQRGFQANARTITTSDEMLQELVNIKR